MVPLESLNVAREPEVVACKYLSVVPVVVNEATVIVWLLVNSTVPLEKVNVSYTVVAPTKRTVAPGVATAMGQYIGAPLVVTVCVPVVASKLNAVDPVPEIPEAEFNSMFP